MEFWREMTKGIGQKYIDPIKVKVTPKTGNEDPEGE